MRLRLAGIAAVLAVALAVPMIATGATGIVTTMTGDQIVNPNGGDPDGKANLTLKVNRVKQRVCFQMTTKRLDDVTGAYIHKGKAGEIARPVITLFEGRETGSVIQGCVKGLKKKIVKRLKRKPDKHYADATTTEYPDGAVRGQLEE